MEIHLRDHLGNTRITLLDDGSANSPHVMQELGYPPSVGPHVHLQIWNHESIRINPTPFFFDH